MGRSGKGMDSSSRAQELLAQRWGFGRLRGHSFHGHWQVHCHPPDL